MKKILSSVLIASSLLFTVQSCSAQKVVVNREVETEKDGKMLLGHQTVSQFEKAPYSDWYSKELAEYAMDEKALAELKKLKINSSDITVFVGTWCEDSHRDFPRLMKILKTVEYPEERLKIVAVNRKKESPDGEDGLYNIQKVPTIIVKKYNQELGRIVEMPTTGYIERDLVDILKKYDPSVKDIFKKKSEN